jgi:GAF domain-containing protein/HAMP domain-containing protein
VLDAPRIAPTRSLRFRLLALTLGMTILAVVAVGWIAVNTTQYMSARSQQEATAALRAQAESYLLQLNAANGANYDGKLEKYGQQAQTLAAYLGEVFADPVRYQNARIWSSVNLEIWPQGQWASTTDDLSGAFVPTGQPRDAAVQRDLELSAYLEPLFANVIRQNPTVGAVYFASPRKVLRYYPNISLGEALPPDFNATIRPWYADASRVGPKAKPSWTSPYLDSTGLGLVTTVSKAVYLPSGELIGVVGMDITLNEMTASIAATQLMGSGYSFLLDFNGQALALPDRGYEDLLGRARATNEMTPDLRAAPTGFAPVITAMLARQSGFRAVESSGRELFVAYTPLTATGWGIASVVPAESVLAGISELQAELDQTARSALVNRVLPVTAAILVFLSILILTFITRALNPVRTLVAAAEKLANSQWDIGALPNTQDELGLLGRTFSSMARQLQSLVTGLEARVADRTRDLEQRSASLQLAAEVARDAASFRDPETLLDHVVHLISERFGYYHAGIFLLDDLREFAVFRAASSPGGQQMLARQHKLQVGQVGIVGYVAAEGQPRVALDVGADAVHFKNPDLPDTRSEAALPLKVGGQVIGVLDVQSTKGRAFNPEDLGVLQILADQVALAIENARLISASQASLDELEHLYRRQVQEDWSKRLEVRRSAYRYDRLGVHAAPELSDEPTPAANNDDAYSLQLPIELRGQRLGLFQVRRDPSRGPWRPEELELARATIAQMGQALESARLFQEMQAQANREQAINQLSATISRSLDVDTLLKTVLGELGRLPDVVEAAVHIEAPAPHQAPNGHSASPNGGRHVG